MVENRCLTVELADGAVNPRFAELRADVVDEIAGGEIVGAVDNEVVSADGSGEKS